MPLEPLASVSIHAPRVGSDAASRYSHTGRGVFQSTLPAWGATSYAPLFRPVKMRFQSTLPVWGATGGMVRHPLDTLFQSTLPAWGATGRTLTTSCKSSGFNPRSPRGERRNPRTIRAGHLSFNPRSPRGERRRHERDERDQWGVSIHAPRVGSDGHGGYASYQASRVSIHAPRVGSDTFEVFSFSLAMSFNPRSPRWERHV